MSAHREPLFLLFVVALVPFLEFFAHNFAEGIVPSDLAPYFGITLAILGLTYGALCLVSSRDPIRIAVPIAIATTVVFDYHELASAMEEASPSAWLQLGAWAVVFIACLTVGITFAGRRGFQLFVLLISFASLVPPAARIVIFGLPGGGPGLPGPQAYPLEANEIWSGQPTRKPNIYWIVTDSYPSPRQLGSYYRFQEPRFPRFLRSHGFSFSPDTYSNYNLTRLSVPSTLNMEYILEEGESYAEYHAGKSVWLPGRTNRDMVEAISGDNRSVAFLRQLGYRYVHYEGRSFVLTRCRGYEDHCIEGTIVVASELEHQLLSMTPYAAVVALSESFRRAVQPRRRSPSGTGIPELARALAELTVEPPFFLYAHLATPHRPFLNDAKCNVLPLDYDRKDKHSFLEQVQCVNRHLTGLLVGLLARDPSAIVLLTSDHGPRHSVPALTPLYELDDVQIRESLGILSALRLPADCARHLRPNLTPINHMRLVFACLGGHEPNYIEERHFIARPDSPDRGGLRRVHVR